MRLTIDNSVILEAPRVTPAEAIRRILDELCANPSEDEPQLDIETLKTHLELLREGYGCQFIEDLPGPLGFFVEESLRCGEVITRGCRDFIDVLWIQQRREFARAA